MKQLSTLLLIGSLCLGVNAIAQNCTSPASSYDLTVVSYTVVPPNASPNYMQGYVCPGATLLDSAICCTRFVNVDSGATMIVGPNSYGMAYVKSGGTFNGQGASNNWQVYAESGANIINHTGMNNACPQVIFTAGICGMSIAEQFGKSAMVVQNENQLVFHYTDVLNAPRVDLYDQTGKLVLSSTTSAGTVQNVDIAGLASGIYMWRVYDGEEMIGSDKISVVK